MSARDDYPTLGWHSIHHDRTNLGEQLRDALNEIDALRSSCAALNDEVNHWVAMSNADAELHRQLRESHDALMSNSAVEHQPMSTVCSKCARFHIGASCRPPRSEAE